MDQHFNHLDSIAVSVFVYNQEPIHSILIIIKLTLQQRQWWRCLKDWETEFVAASPFLPVKSYLHYRNIKISKDFWFWQSPVSTMNGLTSIRWTRLPGWVCNQTINDRWDWLVICCLIFLPEILSFFAVQNSSNRWPCHCVSDWVNKIFKTFLEHFWNFFGTFLKPFVRTFL